VLGHLTQDSEKKKQGKGHPQGDPGWWGPQPKKTLLYEKRQDGKEGGMRERQGDDYWKTDGVHLWGKKTALAHDRNWKIQTEKSEHPITSETK